jgi:hypothetical protein
MQVALVATTINVLMWTERARLKRIIEAVHGSAVVNAWPRLPVFF